MKIKHILGLCSLAMVILHSSVVGAVEKEKKDNERWTQPKPPEYGPRWQVPENMQKGQSGQAGTDSDSQESQQAQQFMKSGSGPSGFAPSSTMKMQTMPTTTMPKVQVAPTIGGPSLPRTQVAPAVTPTRQPTVSVPGIGH